MLGATEDRRGQILRPMGTAKPPRTISGATGDDQRQFVAQLGQRIAMLEEIWLFLGVHEVFLRVLDGSSVTSSKWWLEALIVLIHPIEF